MGEQLIEAALREATDTRNVNIGVGALASVPGTFLEGFGDGPAVVVADGTTFEVAGGEVRRRLEGAGHTTIEPYVFPTEPPLYAEYSNIEKLRGLAGARCDSCGCGVGDYKRHRQAGRPRVREALHVRRNGCLDGRLHSFRRFDREGRVEADAVLPRSQGRGGDLEVTKHAPEDMTASGYADLLGKVTSGADWLIADALEVEKIDPVGWSLVQDHLRGWTDSPAELRTGDEQSTGRLMEGLILSGLGMQSYQSSRTALGPSTSSATCGRWKAWDTAKVTEELLSHGFKVGVGTVAIAALYELILERDLSSLTSNRCATPGPPGKPWNDPCGRSMRARTWREAPSSRPSPNTSAPASSRGGWNCFGMYGPDCARRLECS